MVSTFSSHAGSSSNFRDLLELNYQNKSVVHLTAGSVVPLLKQSVWVVVRGLVKLVRSRSMGMSSCWVWLAPINRLVSA